MGVFKRYRDAQAAQKDAENAMPGAYQSNYTDRINEALDSMGAASNAGYDVGTDSELYRQYRAGAQANARAAAENAAAGAAALSGGYGSSYANSVAQQGYQQAMANVDDGLTGLRDKALTMYQLKQNGLSGLLSALQNQDSLEAAEHQGAVANAQDWRDYKKSRADQAAQEKSDFLSNLWEMAKSVGRAGLTAYDTYKGYTQQQWENEFAREQWEYNKERTGQSDALNAYEQAFNLYQQGAAMPRTPCWAGMVWTLESSTITAAHPSPAQTRRVRSRPQPGWQAAAATRPHGRCWNCTAWIRTLWGITGRSQDGSLQRRWRKRAQAARAALRAEEAAERKAAGAAGRTVSCKVWQRHFPL